jgi:hypothetical protein
VALADPRHTAPNPCSSSTSHPRRRATTADTSTTDGQLRPLHPSAPQQRGFTRPGVPNRRDRDPPPTAQSTQRAS